MIVTGMLFGHILHTKKEQIGRRLAVWGCLLGGLGNTANAAVLYLFPDQAATRSATQFSARQVVTTQEPLSFLLLSFIVGVLIVGLVVVSAVLTQKRTLPRLPFRKREEEDDLE
ncbi:MAG: hypothetical protein V1857_04390 [archaeon]